MEILGTPPRLKCPFALSKSRSDFHRTMKHNDLTMALESFVLSIKIKKCVLINSVLTTKEKIV